MSIPGKQRRFLLSGDKSGRKGTRPQGVGAELAQTEGARLYPLPMKGASPHTGMALPHQRHKNG
jgi:hypothetical protein